MPVLRYSKILILLNLNSSAAHL